MGQRQRDQEWQRMFTVQSTPRGADPLTPWDLTANDWRFLRAIDQVVTKLLKRRAANATDKPESE